MFTAASVGLSAIFTLKATAQDGVTQAQLQDISTPKVLPPPDFKFDGKVGKTYKDSDPPQFPQPMAAPTGAPNTGAPNVVLIMLDDTGFGQYSAFGGGVPSPTLDKLAGEG